MARAKIKITGVSNRNGRVTISFHEGFLKNPHFIDLPLSVIYSLLSNINIPIPKENLRKAYEECVLLRDRKEATKSSDELAVELQKVLD